MLPFEHRWVMAPMVAQSDLPFRLLCRLHGTQVCYTEMLESWTFAADPKYREAAMASCSITVGGVEIVDRPLVVQFAANDPAVLLEAALHAQALGADAVDINFGCPQRRASEGHYGAAPARNSQ